MASKMAVLFIFTLLNSSTKQNREMYYECRLNIRVLKSNTCPAFWVNLSGKAQSQAPSKSKMATAPCVLPNTLKITNSNRNEVSKYQFQ